MSDNTIWKVQNSTDTFGLSSQRIFEILLKNRNLNSRKDIENFLNPSIKGLLDMQFPDLDKTLNRIKKAIDSKEKIVVYSDYDADGISAAAILWETLHSLDASVLPYIPDRLKEGYGFSNSAIKSLAKSGVTLIISVDHGITAVDEINFANSLGLDVILTDHHLPPKNLPKPFAMIHTTEVCGAVVAWKLAYEINKFFKKPIDEIYEKLSIASIATIADQMPLLSYNRAVVKHGLEYLKLTKRPGLIELFNASVLKPSIIDEYHLGHIIAPRINAMGRLDNAIQSLRLYCTQSPQKAKELSEILHSTNLRRQELTSAGVAQAYQMVNLDHNLLILDSPDWHEGVIGLIAGRINDRFNKPTIAISIGDKFSKGSARSVEGVDITQLLRDSTQNLLDDVGGHTMASGFTIQTQNIPKFKKTLLESFNKLYANTVFSKQISAEVEVLGQHISMDLYNYIQQLKPFGNGNPEPLFLSRKMKVIDIRRIGSDQSHIKIDFSSIPAVGFGLAEKCAPIRPGDEVDIIFHLNLNEFNGHKSLQLILKDIAHTGDKNILRT